jgi:hypothetical protein
MARVTPDYVAGWLALVPALLAILKELKKLFPVQKATDKTSKQAKILAAISQLEKALKA